MIDRYTNNKSFVDMSDYLSLKGIVNNNFMLERLNDKESIRYAPHEKEDLLTLNDKKDVLEECVNNFWFYLREIVRIPNINNTYNTIQLNRSNLALFYLFSNNFNIINIHIRQSGMLTASLICLLYAFAFHNSNSYFDIVSPKETRSIEDAEIFHSMDKLLPKYLQPERKIRKNTHNFRNENLRNRLTIHPAAVSEVRATNMARGLTGDIVLFDEFSYIKYNNILYDQRVKFNIKNSTGYNNDIVLMSPTTLKKNEAAKFAKSLLEKYIIFEDYMYDLDIEDLRKNSDNTMVIISDIDRMFIDDYSKEKYLNIMKRAFKNNEDGFRREVLLEWI